jgi:ferredoxin, 2Fe-2S
MPQVTFVYPSGERTILDIPVGKSVMQGAIGAGLDGIIAECGGEMVCATCHVYILSSELADQLPQKTAIEEEMLNFTVSARDENSRLSCQLLITAPLDGLVVGLPEAQV